MERALCSDLQHLQRLVVHGLACRGQACGVRAAIDQIGPGPGLQRLDTAREAGCVTWRELGRAAKAARLSQADKIFKPFGFHRRDYRLPSLQCFRAKEVLSFASSSGWVTVAPDNLRRYD